MISANPSTFEEKKCSKKWKCYSHHTMSNHQCTMGKLKNGVNSGQIWRIISPLIFIANLWNIAQSCLNSSKIIEYLFCWTKLRKKWVKTQKAVGGAFSSQDWSPKKFCQKNCFLTTLVALDFTLVCETLGLSFKLA